MNSINYRVSLDMFEALSQTTIKAKKGDSACKIYITLTENGKMYKIGEGCYATFGAKKSDGTFVYDDCTIEGNTIVYDFSASNTEDGTCQITACEGIVECEVTLYKGNAEQLTSPRFTLKVDGTVYTGEDIISTPEANALKELVNDANEILSEMDAELAEAQESMDAKLAEAQASATQASESAKSAGEAQNAAGGFALAAEEAKEAAEIALYGGIDENGNEVIGAKKCAEAAEVSAKYAGASMESAIRYAEDAKDAIEEYEKVTRFTDQEGIVFGDSVDNAANGKYSISGGYNNKASTKVIGVVEVIKRSETRFTFVLNGKHQEIENYINQSANNRYATVMSAAEDSISSIWHNCIIFNSTTTSSDEVTEITGDLKIESNPFRTNFLSENFLYYMWFPNNPSLGYVDVVYDPDGGYVQPWVGATTFGFNNRVVGKGAASVGAGNINNGAHSFTAGAMNIAVTNATAVGAYNNANAPYSFAGGRSNIANGNAAFVYGRESYATGDESASLGLHTQANGNNSFATNQYTQADGDNSSAFGLRSKAVGKNSLATGQDTEANAENSATFGNSSIAKGNGSMAAGRSSETSEDASYSFALGRYAKTTKTGECAVGVSNVSDENTLFSVGNGKVGGEERKNAFQVNKDGTATVQTAPKKDNDVATKKYVDDYIDKLSLFAGLKGQKSGNTVCIENAEQNPLDRTITVQVESKNILNYKKFPQSGVSPLYGIAYTNSQNGEIKFLGTATSDYAIYLLEGEADNPFKSGKTYFVSKLSGAPSGVLFYLRYKDEFGTTRAVGNGSILWKEGYTFLNCYVYIPKGTVIDATVFPQTAKLVSVNEKKLHATKEIDIQSVLPLLTAPSQMSASYVLKEESGCHQESTVSCF